jgi:hypothetical protein
MFMEAVDEVVADPEIKGALEEYRLARSTWMLSGS